MRKRRRAPAFYVITLLHVGCFALFHIALWQSQLSATGGAGRLLWWLKVLLEVLASFYFFSALLKSMHYLLGPAGASSAGVPGGQGPAGERRSVIGEREDPPARPRPLPPVACVYLCAGDLDARALESLCRIDYPGRLHVFVHDDSGDKRTAEQVDAQTRALTSRTGRPVYYLSRKTRTGGKPGAVNYVLSLLGNRYPFVLLADNDSTAVDPRFLTRALPFLDDSRVAAVQFRNVAVDAPGERPINRILRRAIEVFDLFASHQALHGMALFFGHNALLRTAALHDAGGLREGIFADDVDLSIRLVRRGWKIVYAPGIAFGETHPVSYAAFRRRAYKWAFGCGQVLRDHLLPVLLDRRLRFSQKAGLLEFTGFYAIQVVLILYLVLIGLVLPVVSDPPPGHAAGLLLSGVAIILSIFLPSLAYFARHRRLSEWWPFALVCAVVYGSVAFASARGLLDGALGRTRTWIPTNLAGRVRAFGPAICAEAIFGLLLVLVPATFCPEILWQPSLYLFATVFLFSPFALLFYAPAAQGERGSTPGAPAAPPGGPRPRRRPVRVRLAAITLAILGLAALQWAVPSQPQRPRVAIDGDRILADGAPFLVKGIHYSPWLPGTGPMKDHAWPDEAVVSRDLAMIRGLGANTILVHDAPASLFALARRFDLMVIHAYYVNWQSIGDELIFGKRSAEIARSIAEVADEPNLLAILLGNEVLEWILKERGDEFIDARLRSLYDAAKRVAPHVPIGHANWPPAKSLSLSYMDIACFNLYPAWPREVVVAGYGHYIETVLKPIAAGRPLLITEFGQNSLETTEQRQVQVLRESWEEIRRLTSGGVVFEFTDEWWKNYDNPIGEGDYWQRQHAPDDERTHDLDPEEHYGVVTSDRNPKPAYEAVRAMYAVRSPAAGRVLLYATPLLALFGYTLYLFWRQR